MQGTKGKGFNFFMNEKIEKQKDMFRRINALWDKTEKVILRFFDALEHISSTEENSEIPLLPKMTDFNIITASIKRLQEARLALLKEEFQDESHARTDEPDPQSAQEEISRILEALEKNGTGETPDTDEMPDGC